MIDWTTFTKRIAIKAETPTLYNAWATQEGLETWFLRKAEFTDQNGVMIKPELQVKARDSFFWLWHGFDDSVCQKGEVLLANGVDQFDFTFEGCRVSILLTAKKGHTMVELTQSGISTDDQTKMNTYAGCGEGWTFYLTNLKSIFEGGLDLRNKDDQLERVVNA